MLTLKNITKTYGNSGKTGEENTVNALKGVSVSFRKNEFVSILGHSGCGKTTLLNIIGGLDKYTSGDLIIEDVSTKEYKDRDWDVYRNHRIGFVFQSYNLIPHQTVLGNVELALTISGISKDERKKRAKMALDRVGLSGKYNKKPNQLSGGQCQRVAIARALVNNPEILLADEPTGALDTETSVQIMELIKEIAKERLVIMVTHNPELAHKYSTRIINLKDGEVVEDTMPFTEEEAAHEARELVAAEAARIATADASKKKNKRKDKAKMSLFTAFRLSANNLISKKGRTITIGIAGSIGIIGIALVLAISAGIRGYFDSIQDDMLSGNPITITETGYDLNAISDMMSGPEKKKILKEPNRIYVNSLIEMIAEQGDKMKKIIINNEIDQKYIDYVEAMPEDYYAAITLDYGVNVGNNIYLDITDDAGKTRKMSYSAIVEMYESILGETAYKDYSSYIPMFANSFAIAPNNDDYILSQYDIVSGDIAKNANEVMLVLDKDSEISDILLAQLGYYTQKEFINLAYSASKDPGFDEAAYKNNFTYEELLGKTFTWHSNDAIFEATGKEMSPYIYKAYDDNLVDNSKMELKVVGILEPKDTVKYGCLTSGIYYTSALSDYILKSNKDSDIVKYLSKIDGNTITSVDYMQIKTGIMYNYDYTYNGVEHKDNMTFLGKSNDMANMMSFGMGSDGDSDSKPKETAKYYTLSMRELGGCDVANGIIVYPTNFDSKDQVTDYLDKWNDRNEAIEVNGQVLEAADRQEIKYTDSLALIIDIMNTLLNIISIGLIAFTSISLIVSTVMIGIITYVSVVERIKEIGVIRSLGGRKKDVSHLFNAETFIIGFLAGLIGVLFTYFVSIFINMVIYSKTEIKNIAALPISQAIFLIILSIILTLISGLIPARSAAKKDPVVALRTE